VFMDRFSFDWAKERVATKPIRRSCDATRKYLPRARYTSPSASHCSLPSPSFLRKRAIFNRRRSSLATRLSVTSFRDVLQESGLAPQYLELELTESLLLGNADVTLSVLQELTEMGLKLAIDDFGTGYSSLSYLKQFPVGKLKIDRSFIRDIAADCSDAAITAAIISMAKNLHLKVIAEGVETEAQMSFLRGHKCDEIQGYYFSKPISADAAASILIGQAGHTSAEHPSERVFGSIPVSV